MWVHTMLGHFAKKYARGLFHAARWFQQRLCKKCLVSCFQVMPSHNFTTNSNVRGIYFAVRNFYHLCVILKIYET